jgi:hypothetical protein
VLLICNYITSGKEVSEEFQGVVGSAEVLNSDTEKERLQDRNKLLLSKVK